MPSQAVSIESPYLLSADKLQPHMHCGDNLFSPSERIEYLKQFGQHSQHFTALQPMMEYFDAPGLGYLAYAKHLGRSMVLGDPVCAFSSRKQLLERFLDAHSDATFVQVSQSVADLLRETTGFYATQFGQELMVPIEDWTTSGKDRKVIRKAINQAARQGITVSESDTELNVDAVSADWLGTRKTRREIAFMVRPRKMQYTEGCRYFYAWKDNEPIGFAYFDPAYKNGRVVSYLPNISRGCASFRQGLFYTIMVHAIETFHHEGIDSIDLGLCPLALSDQPQPHESGMLRKVFELTYKHCFHYNCKGIHFTKQRFGGDWSPTYICHRNRMPVVDIWRLLRL